MLSFGLDSAVDLLNRTLDEGRLLLDDRLDRLERLSLTLLDYLDCMTIQVRVHSFDDVGAVVTRELLHGHGLKDFELLLFLDGKSLLSARILLCLLEVFLPEVAVLPVDFAEALLLLTVLEDSRVVVIGRVHRAEVTKRAS